MEELSADSPERCGRSRSGGCHGRRGRKEGLGFSSVQGSGFGVEGLEFSRFRVWVEGLEFGMVLRSNSCVLGCSSVRRPGFLLAPVCSFSRGRTPRS